MCEGMCLQDEILDQMKKMGKNWDHEGIAFFLSQVFVRVRVRVRVVFVMCVFHACVCVTLLLTRSRF